MASFSSSSSSSSNLFILVLPILLLLSSLPSLTMADDEVVRPVPRSDVTKTITCMELLMRCQYQLRDPHPTSACCAPLKYTVTHDIQCLCSLSFNEDMLLYLNITFQNILTLPERCKMEMPDLTFCANYGKYLSIYLHFFHIE